MDECTDAQMWLKKRALLRLCIFVNVI